MKNLLLIFSLLICSISFSQSESDILFIKSKIENVNAQSKNYKLTVISKTDETEMLHGNEIAVFTDDLRHIKLIRETYLNETGKTVIWDYIENNHAYFILKEYFTYKFPVADKKFNEADFTKTDEGFYLKNDRVIRWMKGTKLITKYPKNAASIENNMIEHIADLVAKFNQQTTK